VVDLSSKLDTTITRDTHRNALQPDFRLHWYRIGYVLGQGGFGITYLATDENLRVPVAIKEYLPGDLSTRDSDSSVQPVSGSQEDAYRWGLERFMTEARTLARFRHPNIVEVRSVFEANNTAYMVMTYETGDSLTEVLAQRGTLEEEELKAIALPILDGLAQVHAAGFIHRDIKPSNIYLRRDGQPVLLDFGSARQAVGERTRTLTSVVSPGYAPFEQYYSKSDRQGPWTDIYGMGATLYHGVTGRAPLTAVDRSEGVIAGGGDGMQSARANTTGRYSPAFLAAIDHALAFRLEDRPQTIAAWREEFFNAASTPIVPEPITALAGKPPTSRVPDELPRISSDDVRRSFRSTSEQPESRPRRKGPVVLAGAIGLGVVLIAGGVYFLRDRTAGTDTAAHTATPAQTAPPQPATVQASTTAPASPPVSAPAPETQAPAPTPEVVSDTEDSTARVAELLREADEASAAGRLAGTAGDSAAEAYQAALAIDPANEAAQSGLARLAAPLAEEAQSALTAGELDRAANAVEQLGAIDPQAAALPELQANLERAQAQKGKDLEVYKLLAGAKADLEEGRIIAPEGDNALEKYREADSLRPGMGAVKKGYIDIGNYLLDMADKASAADRYDDAYSYLETAKSILPEREEIDEARQYVDNRKMTYDMKQSRREQLN
jgi:serine/threonine protein kinase